MAKICPHLLLLLLLLHLHLLSLVIMNSAKADVAAIFIFGDSTMDVGTNTCLNGSVARADRPFNGIDFPFSKPTGRFSNGYNTADLLVRLLSKNYKRSPPPFLSLLRHNSTFKRNLLLGANFASGGSGILNTTGKVLFVVSLGEQIKQFSTAVANIRELLGQDKAAALISSNSLYIISVGSNDLFEYQRNSSNMSSEAFLSTLHDEYLNHLKNLYNLGARKFAIISAPAIGCCPYERFLNQMYNNGSGADCYDEMNDLAQSFYNLTQIILQEFSWQCSGVVYSLGNAYQATMVVINNPLLFGMKDVQTPCCTSGTFSDLGLCTESDNVCRNREDYLFWDWYHPTQHASRLAALTLYGGAPPFVTPVNFSQLVL